MGRKFALVPSSPHRRALPSCPHRRLLPSCPHALIGILCPRYEGRRADEGAIFCPHKIAKNGCIKYKEQKRGSGAELLYGQKISPHELISDRCPRALFS